MTTFANPFAVLGLTEDATPDDVRRAYRRLALTYHPDRNAGDPLARERFLAVRQAFDQLETKDPDAGYDTERVVAQMQKAAEEVERRRSRGGGGGRGWQLIRIPLTMPRDARIRAALFSYTAGLGVVMGTTAAVATVLSGLVPIWVAPLVGLGVTAGLLARAFRQAHDDECAVETHWQGLRDLRWDVLVSWSEIQGLRPGDGVLDLSLAPRAAGRLSAIVPGIVFPEPTVYRLPVADPARVAALLRAQVGRVEGEGSGG